MQEMYGATRFDWDFFAYDLGLLEDLLPVVSDPDAAISPQSNLKALGKVPSTYNKAGEVVGFNDWTSHVTQSYHIDRWSKQGLGICVQTRRVRAIDIDVEDPDLADKIEDLILSFFIHDIPPVRYRENSAKRLIIVEAEGELSKRVLKFQTDSHAAVELLGDGQQFVAVGTHPSGQRYYWEGLDHTPKVSLEDLDKMWVYVVDRLGLDFIDQETGSGVRNPRGVVNAQSLGSDRPILDFLHERDIVRGSGIEGQQFITCPFKDEHTTDSGLTETAYFPAGTRGYEQGHFKCLHAHCAQRSDDDFLNALGYYSRDFQALTTQEAETSMPALVRKKTGEAKATLNNLIDALSFERIVNIRFIYDRFRDEIYLVDPETGGKSTLTDLDYVIVRQRLERATFESISTEMIRDAIEYTAHTNSYDSAQDWLNALEWDGEPRVRDFIANYAGGAESEYTRSISEYMWSAMAGRVLAPGIKADMVPVLVGQQGTGKSTSVALMSPDPDMFCEVSLHERDDDLARKMKGCVLAEISELRGFNVREAESVKSFITRQYEHWTPKYKEKTTKYPRRILFIGTTNDGRFLSDPTGNRRWLPVHVGPAALEAIETDRDQLWAEARELYKASGIRHTTAEQLGFSNHKHFQTEHVWTPKVYEWVATQTEPFTTLEIMRSALGFQTDKIRPGEQHQVENILKRIGFKPEQAPEGYFYRWVRTDQAPEAPRTPTPASDAPRSPSSTQSEMSHQEPEPDLPASYRELL